MSFTQGVCKRHEMMTGQYLFVDMTLDIIAKGIHNLLHDVPHRLLVEPFRQMVDRHDPSVCGRIPSHDCIDIIFCCNPFDFRMMNFPVVSKLVHFTGEDAPSAGMPGFLHPDCVEMEPLE